MNVPRGELPGAAGMALRKVSDKGPLVCSLARWFSGRAVRIQDHFAGYTRIQWLRTRAFTRVSLKSRTSELEACTGMWQSMQLVAV